MTNAVCLFLAACLGAVLLPPVAIASDPPGTRDGEIRPTGGGGFLAWDAEGQAWLLPEAFWESYASRSGGVTWGRRTDYPEYGQVKEHDTLIIELDGETCLMEFFHRRWRRANDVHRWDAAFNEYGACPKVFD